MSRLKEIAAAHADRPAQATREAEQRRFKKKMRQEKLYARAREAAMKEALSITGRVIFPGRWTAEEAPYPSDWEVRCTCRWEGLRLVFYWRRGSVNATFTKLEAQYKGNEQILSSEASLASALRDWGLA